MTPRRSNHSGSSTDAASFLSAMNELNQQHPPNPGNRLVYRPLIPPLSLPQPVASTSASTETTPAPSPVDGQRARNTPNPCFHMHVTALLALPEAERREKNRHLTASRANHFRHVLERRDNLIKMRVMMRPEVWAAQMGQFEVALRTLRMEYCTVFCLTFRINDLPVELLTEIFRLVVWPLSNVETDVRAVVRLTHVCRLWRSVSISDRHLWNPVCFVDPKRYERTFALMERAGPSGLDVRIRDSQEQPFTRDNMVHLISRIFLKLPSIRKLDVFIYGREAVLPIILGLQKVAEFNVPMELEHLEIHSYLSPGIPLEFFPPYPLFGGVIIPSFRHLRLNGVNALWDVHTLSRLTTLDLRRIAMELLPSPADFRAVLQGATGLAKLILDGAGPKYEPYLPLLPPIPIPTLRILVLGGFSDLYAEYVLSYFSCPNVLDLTLMFPMNNLYSRLITAMITKCKMPNVKILVLLKVPLSGSTVTPELRTLLARWLETMPDLTFLRLMQTSREIFDVLKFEPTTPESASPEPAAGQTNIEDDGVAPRPKRLICPKVIYMDCQCDLVDVDIFFDWIAHRRLMGCPLRKIWMAHGAVTTLSAEQKNKMWQALGGLGVPQVASYRTLEEEALCKQI